MVQKLVTCPGRAAPPRCPARTSGGSSGACRAGGSRAGPDYSRVLQCGVIPGSVCPAPPTPQSAVCTVSAVRIECAVAPPAAGLPHHRQPGPVRLSEGNIREHVVTRIQPHQLHSRVQRSSVCSAVQQTCGSSSNTELMFLLSSITGGIASRSSAFCLTSAIASSSSSPVMNW